MQRLRRDDGVGTLFWMVMGLLLLGTLAFVVDGGGRMAASAHADDIANEAARVAGQQIDPAQAIPGHQVVADPDAAVAAAESYLADAGMSGTVDITGGGTRIEVTVNDTYHCKLLSAFGPSTMEVTGHGQGHLVHQVGE